MDGIADYVFVEDLGEGNYGRFYLAKRPARLPVQDEFVAVKVLASSPTTEGFQRAVRELRIFAAVQSPYLVPLYDAGRDGDAVYYSMRHYPMGSLLKPESEPTRSQRLRAVADAARAAHALHEAGIVHRDIKPGNILLDEDGGRLSDLGLAQHLHPGMTASAVGSLRSLEFVDPVVLSGGRVSRASDVWSLGVTLHHALAGHGVYPDLPDADVLLALRTIVKDPPLLDAKLSEDERAVLARSLDAEPARRYPTASALADDIESLSMKSRT